MSHEWAGSAHQEPRVGENAERIYGISCGHVARPRHDPVEQRLDLGQRARRRDRIGGRSAHRQIDRRRQADRLRAGPILERAFMNPLR
jgi:hypothetical protein